MPPHQSTEGCHPLHDSPQQESSSLAHHQAHAASAYGAAPLRRGQSIQPLETAPLSWAAATEAAAAAAYRQSLSRQCDLNFAAAATPQAAEPSSRSSAEEWGHTRQQRSSKLNKLPRNSASSESALFCARGRFASSAAHGRVGAFPVAASSAAAAHTAAAISIKPRTAAEALAADSSGEAACLALLQARSEDTPAIRLGVSDWSAAAAAQLPPLRIATPHAAAFAKALWKELEQLHSRAEFLTPAAVAAAATASGLPVAVAWMLLQSTPLASFYMRRRTPVTSRDWEAQEDGCQVDASLKQPSLQQRQDSCLLPQSALDFVAGASDTQTASLTVAPVAVKTPMGVLLLERQIVLALEDLVMRKTGSSPYSSAAGRALLMQLMRQHADNCNSVQEEQQREALRESEAEAAAAGQTQTSSARQQSPTAVLSASDALPSREAADGGLVASTAEGAKEAQQQALVTLPNAASLRSAEAAAAASSVLAE
ncbi:uncharacterized protein LOC34619817 [Cyclospora cayetanensis]|uniref:Uncharacterized protein LOC34619817 n=1 Tax=Cyclospora cayetanensis TaxID=88456 RepID=A0A6P6S206_9EIME|nr:uncharacterized protein LOC34619817 [Cyclospora cayetanensis]